MGFGKIRKREIELKGKKTAIKVSYQTFLILDTLFTVQHVHGSGWTQFTNKIDTESCYHLSRDSRPKW